MNILSAQDQNRILQCLRDGPKTAGEIARHLRLTHTRVSALILEMNRRGQIHAPRCTKGPNGTPVNLWDLRTPMESAP